MRVSPFRHPRIVGYLLLPAAFRSLSRLSSALSAKASALRSSSLNLLIRTSSESMILLERFVLLELSVLSDFSVLSLRHFSVSFSPFLRIF